MDVPVLGMEGVRREGCLQAMSMAPNINTPRKNKKTINEVCNGKVLRGALNGRRLKVNVERLNTTHLSKNSGSLSESKKRNRKKSETCSPSKDFVR